MISSAVGLMRHHRCSFNFLSMQRMASLRKMEIHLLEGLKGERA
jgi:hypothetical protein